MEITQASLTIAKKIEDPYLISFNYYLWGWNFIVHSRLDEALDKLDEGEALAREYQFFDILILILRAKGNYHYVLREYEQAKIRCQEVVDLGELHKLNPAVITQALGELGNIETDLGYPTTGIAYHKKALAMQARSGAPRDKAMILHYMACTQLQFGLNREAIASEEEALEICEEIGDHNLKCWVLNVLGVALRREGRTKEGVRLLEAYLDEANSDLFAREVGVLMIEIGNCHVELAQWEAAETIYRRAMEKLAPFNFLEEPYLLRAGLGFVMMMAGDQKGGYQISKSLAQALQTLDTAGWDDRVRPYLFCYQVLKASEDEMAREMLLKGKAILDELLSKVDDHAIRQSMLENIPEHRELLNLVSQMQ